MGVTPARQPLRLRTVFISDVHLGFRGCRAEYLLDFLDSTDAQHIFVVGDLIDFASMGQNAVHRPAPVHAPALEMVATSPGMKSGSPQVRGPGAAA